MNLSRVHLVAPNAHQKKMLLRASVIMDSEGLPAVASPNAFMGRGLVKLWNLCRDGSAPVPWLALLLNAALLADLGPVTSGRLVALAVTAEGAAVMFFVVVRIFPPADAGEVPFGWFTGASANRAQTSATKNGVQNCVAMTYRQR